MKIILFTICALFIMPVNADAQVTNFIRKKTRRAARTATKTVNKEIDKEIDRQVTKGIYNLRDSLISNATESEAQKQDSSVSTGSQGNSKAAGLGSFSALAGLSGDVPNKGTYSFDRSINIEIEMYDANDKDNIVIMEYYTYISEKNADMAIYIKPQSEENDEQGEMTIIYDQDNNAVFMLTDQEGEKMAIATSMDSMSFPDDEEDIDDTAYEDEDQPGSDPVYTKTGKTKTIKGYKCEQYIMNDEDTRIDMWITDDMDFNPDKEQMEKAGIPVYYDGPLEGGTVMEMELFEDGIKQMYMYVKDIKKNIKQSFSLDAYTIMNVGAGK